MPNTSKVRFPVIWWLYAGALLANLFVAALVGVSLYQSLQQHRQRAEVTTQNLSQILASYIAGIVDKVDLALLTVADEVTRELATGAVDGTALNELLAKQQGHLPELTSLRVTDAQGNPQYGPGVQPASPVNLSDRNFFIRARDEAKGGLILDKPMFARISRKWVIVLARRLQAPDGSFAGVVYANIELDYFSKIFATLDVGRRGSVALRGEDLGLIVRVPESSSGASAIGTGPSPKLQELVRAGGTNGTFVARNPLDGIERTLSYRRLAAKPLYVVVGVGTDDYLAEWREEVVRMAVPAFLFLVLTLVGGVGTTRAWKRQALL